MTADASRLRQALASYSYQVQQRAVTDTATLVRTSGDVPRDTGELVGSIRALPVSPGGSSFRGRLVAPVVQALFTDKGTRPHPIRPKRAGGVLVFPARGGVVFTRSVSHPGTRAQRWWQPAVERSYAVALRIAARSVPFR